MNLWRESCQGEGDSAQVNRVARLEEADRLQPLQTLSSLRLLLLHPALLVNQQAEQVDGDASHLLGQGDHLSQLFSNCNKLRGNFLEKFLALPGAAGSVKKLCERLPSCGVQHKEKKEGRVLAFQVIHAWRWGKTWRWLKSQEAEGKGSGGLEGGKGKAGNC